VGKIESRATNQIDQSPPPPPPHGRPGRARPGPEIIKFRQTEKLKHKKLCKAPPHPPPAKQPARPNKLALPLSPRPLRNKVLAEPGGTHRAGRASFLRPETAPLAPTANLFLRARASVGSPKLAPSTRELDRPAP